MIRTVQMDPQSDEEIWCDVVGWEGRYQVSNRGRVRSFCQRGPGEIKKAQPHVLKAHPNRKGYLKVVLSRPGQRLTKMNHLLVLETFVGPRPQGMETRHLNGNKEDDRLENLAWGTALENQEDRRRHGTMPEGESHPRAKLTANEVQGLRRLCESGTSVAEAARRLGVNLPSAYAVCSRRQWRNT